MYAQTSLDDLDSHEIDDIEPRLKAIGYELRTQHLRPSVWEYEAGESNNRHRQREQEELYFVIDGQAVMAIDGGEIELDEGDFVAVPPESWRQLTATTACTILVVGAPNVKDDAILEDEANAGLFDHQVTRAVTPVRCWTAVERQLTVFDRHGLNRWHRPREMSFPRQARISSWLRQTRRASRCRIE